MTKQQPTAGPWIFDGAKLYQDEGNRLQLGTFSEAPGLGYAADANLRLIEAAPDLLAALECFVMEYHADRNRPECAELFSAAIATIAKVKGEKA